MVTAADQCFIINITRRYHSLTLQLTLVLASVFGIVAYRLTFVSVVHGLVEDDEKNFFARNAKTIASLSGAVINLIVILILNYVRSSIYV